MTRFLTRRWRPALLATLALGYLALWLDPEVCRLRLSNPFCVMLQPFVAAGAAGFGWLTIVGSDVR